MENNIDLNIKWDKMFNVYIVTPISQAGKEYLYKYNRNLHKKSTAITKSSINGFIEDLKIYSIRVNQIEFSKEM